MAKSLRRKRRKSNLQPHKISEIRSYFVADGQNPIGIIQIINGRFVAVESEGDVLGRFNNLAAAVRALPARRQA
jgi:hypothetical protein